MEWRDRGSIHRDPKTGDGRDVPIEFFNLPKCRITLRLPLIIVPNHRDLLYRWWFDQLYGKSTVDSNNQCMGRTYASSYGNQRMCS